MFKTLRQKQHKIFIKVTGILTNFIEGTRATALATAGAAAATAAGAAAGAAAAAAATAAAAAAAAAAPNYLKSEGLKAR